MIPHLGIGGAELQLHQLITHTPRGAARHEVLYYADALDREAENLFEASGIRMRRIPRSSGGAIGFLRRLSAAIRDSGPDVLHCWLVSGCFWGRLAARRSGAPPLVLSFRSSRIEHAGVLRAARWLGDDRAHYLANTRAVADSIRRSLGVPADRITVIPNGVALPEHPARADRRGSADGSPGGAARVVLTVGRLAAEKNYPMLLRVAARFDASEGVRFDVVGHGELQPALVGQAARLGVSDRVRFLGLRRDVPARLESADLFAFTSRIEGSPNALLEAMAAGLPIVSTRFAGVDDILTADHDALLVDHDDDAGFEAALRRLLGDRAGGRAMGLRARRTVEERFGIPAMVDATLAFYRSLRAASA